MARRLAAHFHTMAALRAADEETLAEVDGVGPERARLVHQGLDARAEVIDKLAAAAVDMGEEPAEATAEPGPLDGMTVVVTGAMTGPLANRTRNEMNELIEAAGGRSAGSVSKRTSLLVCGEQGSSKWRKAKELDVRIVTPEEFAKMLGLV
jgi:DNA ligase (NAD+)